MSLLTPLVLENWGSCQYNSTDCTTKKNFTSRNPFLTRKLNAKEMETNRPKDTINHIID